MAIFILNKILLVLFSMCLLNCLKHIWNMTIRLREELPSKYQVTKSERFLLGFSVSYIITTIFTGIIL
jgi:hypothetical protein